MENKITLAHGAGGIMTAQLIENIFKPKLGGPHFTADDAAVLDFPAGKLAFTTDGFIVSPSFFPGGNIGKLSVCGTVNDLACMGAKPLYMTCSFVIEEGFSIEDLERIVQSMADTAAQAGVEIVAGDTKVAGRGQCEGVFITTSGVGTLREGKIGGAKARPGDAVLVTGDIGRHGGAILCARGDFGISANIQSDCAPLWNLVEKALSVSGRIHVIRDATRGGVGTVLNEIAAQSGVGIEVDEASIPVDDSLKGLCGILGLEPLYLACEGRLVMIVPWEDAPAVLKSLQENPYGQKASLIGRVVEQETPIPGAVILKTPIGGRRLLPAPGGELLPRIC